MYTYIKKSLLSGYITKDVKIDTIPGFTTSVGTTIEDYLNGKFLLLSDDQVAFHKAHPDATVLEVFNMKIDEPVIVTPPERTLDDAKNEMIWQIENDYIDAQKFYVGDNIVWFDTQERVAIRLKIEAEQNFGGATVTLWANDTAYTLPVNDAIYMLMSLEHYNTQIEDNMRMLKSMVMALQSIQDVDNFDSKQGYPEPITFPDPNAQPETPTQPDEPVSETHMVSYKIVNCRIDNDITEVAHNDRWKTSIYPEDGLALHIADIHCEMDGKRIDMIFEDDIYGRKGFAASARVEIEAVTGDIFVAGIAY